MVRPDWSPEALTLSSVRASAHISNAESEHLVQPVSSPRRTRRLRAAAATLAATAALTVPTTAGAGSAGAAGQCPSLYVLAVQGTGQSSPDASPTSDTGMLGKVLSPLMASAGGLVQRMYIPYEASFGGAVPGGQAKYTDSVTQAIARTETASEKIVAQCGAKTKLAYVGYSQGGHAISNLAKKIGAGTAKIAADQVAVVATFGDPERPKGASIFPGDPGRTSPAAIPGAKGTSVTSLTVSSSEGPKGGGVAPEKSVDEGYGALTGRVMSRCESGDLACDAPTNSPIVHVVANVAGQSQLNPDDPTAALVSLAEAVGLMTVKAAPAIINDDITSSDGTLTGLSYAPQQTLSQRLATASDPSAPLPGVDESLRAILKIGSIGLNTVITVAKKVFTPATIAELATVGLANPAAALGVLATKTASATLDLVPPETLSRWGGEALSALKSEITTNADLLDVSNLLTYFDAARKHGSYASTPTTADGKSTTQFVTEWLTKAAADISGSNPSDNIGALIPTNLDLGIPTTATSTTNSPAASTPPAASTAESTPPGTSTAESTPSTTEATPATSDVPTAPALIP